MRADIHPEYVTATVKCSCGNTFTTRSTKGGELHIELCNECHPFFTGKQKLVDTGSRMDEVIFEEFKGTGNMELRLDRRAAEQRVYPAIDVDASSTRHEELLLDPDQLQQVWKLRRLLSALAANGEPAAGLELVVDRMRKFPTNKVFLTEVAKGPAVG